MIVKGRDGEVIAKNVYAFYEQKKTLIYIEDVDRLKRLHDVRLEQDRVSLLVQKLCAEFDLKKPTLRFTGYTDSARWNSDYWVEQRRDGYRVGWKHIGYNVIVIRENYISTQILIHELAHHWVGTKMIGVEDRSHGFDFAIRLEKLAVAAECFLGKEGL